MRFLCEVFVVAALIYLGWQKPFKEWVPWGRAAESKPAVTSEAGVPLRPTAKGAPTPRPQLRPIVRATPTPSGAWMWDPNRHSPLDRPAYQSRDQTQGSPNPHSPLDRPAYESRNAAPEYGRYRDDTGRTYWIDGQGVRHYDSVVPPPATSSLP